MGYDYKGMKKISYDEAKTRINNGKPVYLLSPGNTENLARDIGEAGIHFNCLGGEFGYKKKVIKTEIVESESKATLMNKVELIIRDKKHIKLTWKIRTSQQRAGRHSVYVCFVEYKEAI